LKLFHLQLAPEKSYKADRLQTPATAAQFLHTPTHLKGLGPFPVPWFLRLPFNRSADCRTVL